ncbi:hypothetical protein EJB05_05098 [Eragrostis curvula]|uniref:Secreted protein n=1 Tax=Eragrostis curvula TaxID=38414 RepID=A0A5J9WCH4_9POAL|nr:hypothetical protein EJB05_05098 [Eragrostis curvula]
MIGSGPFGTFLLLSLYGSSDGDCCSEDTVAAATVATGGDVISTAAACVVATAGSGAPTPTVPAVLMPLTIAVDKSRKETSKATLPIAANCFCCSSDEQWLGVQADRSWV